MNQKKDTQNLMCSVCNINLKDEAEKALHDFTKKHIDSLIRIAKNKPITSKIKVQKATTSKCKNDKPGEQHMEPGTGTITQYGYFVPGEIETVKQNLQSKQFDTNYDPYLQKFAENPFKEVGSTEQPVQTTNVTSFSRKKKKKRKFCQICNIQLNTVPEYEAHMKSPMHTWKLKLSGMGVSAHFVKASTDLHTTDNVDEEDDAKEDGEDESSAIETEVVSRPVPSLASLFCDVCELLLNSEQQYNAHITGKTHLDIIQKKNEMKEKKEKLMTPVPGQLFCYSCQLPLANLLQFNEHKNGKKHFTKCRLLMKQGITIPPEERAPKLPNIRFNPNKLVIYPESYNKYVLQPKLEADKKKEVTSQKSIEIEVPKYHCKQCEMNFNNEIEFGKHQISGIHLKNQNDIKKQEQSSNINKKYTNPAIVFHKGKEETKVKEPEEVQKEFKKPNIVEKEKPVARKEPETPKIKEKEHTYLCNVCGVVLHLTISQAKEHFTTEKHVITLKNLFPCFKPELHNFEQFTPICRICDKEFLYINEFEFHFRSIEHISTVSKLRLEGKSEYELLMLQHIHVIELHTDSHGKYYCVTCSVQLNSVEEFKQHLDSLFHKFADRELRRKRSIEIRETIKPTAEGKYVCKICNETLDSILLYNDHLRNLKHKYTKKAINAKKYKEMSLKRRHGRWKKSKFYYILKNKFERNPGIRTKIAGIATDLNTGEMASIPNLEGLEPKIDPVKNVDIGVSSKNDKKKSIKRKKMNSKLKKRNIPLSNMGNRGAVPPLMASDICRPVPHFAADDFDRPGPFLRHPDVFETYGPPVLHPGPPLHRDHFDRPGPPLLHPDDIDRPGLPLPPDHFDRPSPFLRYSEDFSRPGSFLGPPCPSRPPLPRMPPPNHRQFRPVSRYRPPPPHLYPPPREAFYRPPLARLHPYERRERFPDLEWRNKTFPQGWRR